MFTLNDEERVISETAAAFAAKRLAPYALEWDTDAHFPTDVLREAAELGMAAIYCRETSAGAGCAGSTASGSSSNSRLPIPPPRRSCPSTTCAPG